MNRRDFIKSAGILPVVAMPIDTENDIMLEQLPSISIIPNIANTGKPIIIITGISPQGYDSIVESICDVIKSMRDNRKSHAGIIGLLNTREVKRCYIHETPKENT